MFVQKDSKKIKNCPLISKYPLLTNPVSPILIENVTSSLLFAKFSRPHPL